MDINLPQRPITTVDEFVGCVGRRNDDLPRPRFERRWADSIRRHALLNNEDLLIRVLMQPYPLSWLEVNEDEGDAGVRMQISFKLRRASRGMEFVRIDNNVAYTYLPCWLGNSTSLAMDYHAAEATEPRRRALGDAVLPLQRQRDLSRSATLLRWRFKWFKRMTKHQGPRQTWLGLA